MTNKTNRTPEQAHAIIEHNIQVIYHIPNKYKYLTNTLKSVRKDLLNILHFCEEHDPIIWKNKYIYFIDNKRLTRVRKRTTETTSNLHFNYLCCIGVIRKVKQTNDNMTGVNMTFLLNEREKGKKRPINTFIVPKYTEKRLEQMDARAKELIDNKITAGNISHDKLVSNGLKKLAKEVYFANSKNAIYKKENQFNIVCKLIDQLIAKKGYTTKLEILYILEIKKQELDHLLNIFKHVFNEKYNYKPPTKQEIKQHALLYKKWIITRKEQNNEIID